MCLLSCGDIRVSGARPSELIQAGALLNGTGYLRKGIVGIGAYQTRRASDDDEDDGEHHRVKQTRAWFSDG